MSESPTPLVSVIIPAYNAERFIAETLDSVLNQTWKNIEVFVVDDGSKDKTVEVARTFESDKVKVLVQKNQGACVARNKGLSLSKGKYIQYLDADDVLSSDKIEIQVRILEKNEGYLSVSSSVHFMDGDDFLTKKPREESSWIHNTDDPVDFLVRLYGGYGERWMVLTHAWLTPRSISDKIGPWNENLLLDQDGEYFARAVLASKGIRISGGISYYRRFISGGNISSKYNKKENLQSALLALGNKTKFLGARTDSEAYRQAVATLYHEIAVNAYPMFADIVGLCEKKIKESGKIPSTPVMGGKIIEITKKYFGWKAAKKLRMAFHQLSGKGGI
ncbi:MAG: glycosyl transferase family [Bacteroidetes bacterium]|nr:MAG: glycosyl transferase family [Bacteroidota bacterium]